jgi:Ca2+-binding RTX toxin-like protein
VFVRFAYPAVSPAAGRLHARVTAVDAVGNVSPQPATQAVVVKAVTLDPTATDLYVGGTTGNDTILVGPTPDGKAVTVTINKVVQAGGPFSPTGHILVWGQAGTDSIQVTNLAIPALLFAGSGNTTLSVAGSTANNVLVGGAGKYSLKGGTRQDSLIGGSGPSVLQAGAGGSLLLGGSTAYDTNVAALLALVAEWGRTDVDYPTRVQDLYGEGTGGLNGSYVLTSQTVFKSAMADQLHGGAGLDWFWIKAADQLNGTPQSGEVVTFGF